MMSRPNNGCLAAIRTVLADMGEWKRTDIEARLPQYTQTQIKTSLSQAKYSNRGRIICVREIKTGKGGGIGVYQLYKHAEKKNDLPKRYAPGVRDPLQARDYDLRAAMDLAMIIRR